MIEKASSVRSQHAGGAFPLRTMLFWLGLVLAGGIVIVGLATDYLSELARRHALEEILEEVAQRAPGPASETPVDSKLPPLRLAVAPVISPETSLLLYDDLARYLGDKLGRPAELLVQADYSSTNELLKEGACELALICTYAYIRARAEAQVQVIAVPVVHGKVTYRSLLVVRADSPFRSIEDLRGTRFGTCQ